MQQQIETITTPANEAYYIAALDAFEGHQERTGETRQPDREISRVVGPKVYLDDAEGTIARYVIDTGFIS